MTAPLDKPIEPRRIACRQCGGNITLRGSGEVETVVCSQCGTQYDLSSDESKIVGQLKGTSANTLLAMGSQGTLRGKRYEVIGRVRYRDAEGYVWDEFLLFSPQAGYAWLVYENHHFSLMTTTQLKPLVKPAVLFYRNTFDIEGTSFTVFERLHATLTEVEGELTWVAKVGDEFDGVDAVAPPRVYSIEWSSKEMEYFSGTYIWQQEVIEGFGLKRSLPRPIGVYPCEPYVISPEMASVGRAGWVFSVIFLFLLGWAWAFGRGTAVLGAGFSGQDLVKGFETKEFAIASPNTICKAVLTANVDNAWAWFDVDVIKADEGDVMEFGDEVSYYHGYEDGESWSEGSRSTSQLFKIRDPGNYRFRISGTGGLGDSYQEGYTGFSGSVTAYRDVKMLRFFLFGLVLALTVPLIQFIGKHAHEHNRWASEEEDDDDD